MFSDRRIFWLLHIGRVSAGYHFHVVGWRHPGRSERPVVGRIGGLGRVEVETNQPRVDTPKQNNRNGRRRLSMPAPGGASVITI